MRREIDKFGGVRPSQDEPPESGGPKRNVYHVSLTFCAASGPDSPGMRDAVMNKILLAEDDNDMRRFLVRALQNAGYEVSSYDNGLAAYHRLREEPFELLLTDIVMPEMDGIELARRATELDPDIKVMFITGFAAVALNPDSNAPKDAKVLSKPFHLKDLVNEVEKLLKAA
jgi:two-component system cell cycle response regulator CpdR